MKNIIQSILILGLAGLGLHTASAETGQTPTAAEIFARHFKAMGGRPALEKIQTVWVKGTGQEGPHSFDLEIKLKPPGQILMVVSGIEGMTVRQGRDNQARCWRLDPRGVRELSGDDSGEIMSFVGGFFPPAQLFWDKMLADSVVEKERDGDRELIAIGKKDGGGSFPRLMFDTNTGLLARISQATYADYREVEAVKLPFTAKPNAQTTIQVKEIRFNESFPDELFAKPTDKDAAAAKQAFVPEYQSLASAEGKLEITRRPPPVNFGRGELTSLADHNPKSMRPFQVDLRGYDLSKLEVGSRLNDLLHADFDDRTRWPAQLPAGFDPKRIKELGQDPGLGVRKLHERGILGKGISLGIIDQALLVDHAEYKDRLRMYEEIHSPKNAPAQMHGPAVASIAVGKTIGVAPAADLYYIAEMHGTGKGEGSFEWDFTWLAQSIHRLLDVNKTLPAANKIRALSISVGWSQSQKGYDESMAAVERANKEGVFVISTAIEHTHHLAFHGLGRDPLADPNDVKACQPGSWWATGFWAGQQRFKPGQRLLVPMDCRTTASPTGPNDYVYYSGGGWSWSVPWIAGLYALACEVKPDITPELFWSTALATGRTIKVRHEQEEMELGAIADPVALIEKLRQGK